MTLLIALLFCGSVTARAQTEQLKSEQELIDSRARTYLREHSDKSSPADYRDEATAEIRRQTDGAGDGSEYFDYQRVEASGIFADDPTAKRFPDLFDGRIQPSQVGSPTDETALPKWAQSMEHPIEDLTGLADDSGGQISDYARAAVATYKRAKIREIVAHSWGAEVIYNAIFLGQIQPPKRLILCGVTETDWAKWEALSSYTGTKIIVYDNTLDPAAHAARGLHYADDSVYRFKMTNDPQKLDQMWQTACGAKGRVCNQYARQGEFQRKAYWGLPTHDRFNYYERMLSDEVVAQDVRIVNDIRDSAVDNEAARMFDRALEEARDIVRAEVQLKEDYKPTDNDQGGGSDQATGVWLNGIWYPTKAPVLSVPPPPAPLPMPQAPAQPLDAYRQARAYRDLASKACFSPDDISQADFDALGFAGNSEIYGASDIAASLSGCPRYVFDRMMDAHRTNERLTSSMLLQWAAASRPAVTPPTQDPGPHHRERHTDPADPCRRFYGDYCNS